MDLSILEPDEQALVISTGRESEYEGEDQGRLFWWYYGKPRGVLRCGHYIHDIVGLEDSVLGLIGPHARGCSSNQQGLADLMNWKVAYQGDETLIEIAAKRNTVYGVVATRTLVPDEPGSDKCKPHDKIVEVSLDGSNQTRDLFMHQHDIAKLAPSEAGLWILDYNFKWVTTPQQLLHLQGESTQKVWNNGEGKIHYGSVTGTEEGALIGSVALINRISRSGRQESLLLDEEVRQSYEELEEHYMQSWEFKFRRHKRIGQRKGYRGDGGSTSLRNFYWQNYRVTQLTKFNGEILYAVGKKLYCWPEPQPIHTFRHEITGLTAVDEPLIKELGTRTNMRMGRRRQKAVLRLAA
ncbi:hypothetical protein GOV07_05690 [Candidatus Woesearchaeota archaeon]|nr:hypothetical protein [Candidatus Woesearchaeota archaeon]